MKKKTRALSLVLALVLSLSLALPASAAGGSRFTDVPDNAWYAKAVNTLADGGVLNGRSKGIFEPNANVTLAELSVVIMRLHGMGDGIANEYHWAGEALQTCGFGSDMTGAAAPYAYANEPAFRGDAASIMGEYASVDYQIKYSNSHHDTSGNGAYNASREHAAKYDLNGIADRSAYYALATDVLDEGDDAVFHFYWVKGHNICAEYIDMAYQFGVINGIDKNHTCNATGTLTRAELAQMCYNMGWTTAGCLEF